MSRPSSSRLGVALSLPLVLALQCSPATIFSGPSTASAFPGNFLVERAKIPAHHTLGSTLDGSVDLDFQPDEQSAQLGAWVPIASKSALKGLCPTRVEAMGLHLVVWDDESRDDKWSVMRDVCSHRLAPLSQGRVDRSARPNCVECPYHGWQFSLDGKLTHVPQMEESASLSPALADKASVEAYPVHITGDLIWTFLPTSVHGESFPRDLLPEDYYHNGLRRDCIESSANFAVVDLPASYDFFLENFMDPSHFAFAHHGVIGTRDDAGPLKIDLLPSNFTHVTMQVEYQRKGESRTRIYGIQRPFNGFTLEKSNDDWAPGALAFFVPIAEGRVRFISSLGNNKLSKLPLPHWIVHLLTLKLVDGDFILHDTEREARSSSQPETSKYISPTSADKGVLAFRSWWRKHGLAQAPPHTFGPASIGKLELRPRHEYVNTWQIHTKSCSSCRGALRRAKWLRTWSAVAGISAALGASALRRRAASVLAVSIGLIVSSLGNKIALALEGRPMSDVSDRSVPLD